MNKLIKISSNEGGVFTGTNNRISFNIPDMGVYDLSKSYINLVSSVPITSSTGVVCPVVKMKSDKGTVLDSYFRNSALIKNISFSNQLGTVENVQRSDILSHNLKDYTEDVDAFTSHNYQDLCQPVQTSLARSSIFNELHKEGSSVSKNLLRQPVRVKCSEIMNFWKTKQYSSQRYGSSRLEMELNIDKIDVSQFLSGDDAFGTAFTKQWGQGDAGGSMRYDHFLDIDGGVGEPGVDHLSSKKIQVGFTNLCTPYNRLEDQFCYWVGQQIFIKGTESGGGAKGVNNLATGVVRTITKIDYNRGESDIGQTNSFIKNAITLTLDQALVTADLTAGEKIADLVCIGVPATFGAFQVDYAELVLEQIASPDMVEANKPIQYTSYTTEEFDTIKTQNFQRNFTVEPEAITLYIMSPFKTDDGSGCLDSFQNEFDHYRMRVDNKDVCGRNINLRSNGANRANDPLHTQKQIVSLQNSGKKVKNLLEVSMSVGLPADIEGDYNDRVEGKDKPDKNCRLLIAQVLPRTNQDKQVQLNIDCVAGGGVERLVLFKEVQRMI